METLRPKISVLAILCASLWLMPVLGSQDGPPQEGPRVTELQRLQLQEQLHLMEIAQLKAQAAQRDFDLARAALTKLVQAMQVEGYTFDLQTQTYQRTAKPDHAR